MSSGAAVQIAQYGVENQVVSGNPTSTFFKAVYRRHTNFAIQPSVVTFTGSQDLDDINIIDVPPTGDFIKQIYIKMELPEIALSGAPGGSGTPVWCNGISQTIVEFAELVVGGQTIQRITGEYCYIQLQHRTPKAVYPALQETSNLNQELSLLAESGTFYIPLCFYFHWDSALALPVVALNRQDVKIKLKFKKLKQLIQSYDGTDILPYVDEAAMGPIKFTPFVEYIYVDRVERSKFQDGTELTYLVDQSDVFHMKSITENTFANAILPFKNLVKEIFIVNQENQYTEQKSSTGNKWFNYGNVDLNYKLESMQLKFNGETRVSSDVATGYYLKFIQPMMHHTRTPMQNIFCYSFALHPELSVPTGSVNFSRITNPEIYLKLGGNFPRKIRIHATSMNILQIANDLCCLAFK